MITILNGGCSARHSSSFFMSRPDGLSNYVLLIIHTEGVFLIDGKEFIVSPGEAVVFAPKTSYSYGNPNGEYMDDWLHFNIDFSESALMADLLLNQPFALSSTELFSLFVKQILWESSYGAPEYAQENIDALFSVLVHHLITSTKTHSQSHAAIPYQRELQMLRLNLQNNLMKQPSISTCAQELGISPSYFQHLYSDFFGISFQQDLIRVRIEQAKYMLTTTDMSLEQIAELCGYANEVHFYRQFKRITHTTPAKYKKSRNLFDAP